jgi:prophage regulatory protein
MTTPPRFMTLPDVAAELAVSQSQMYALVKSGDLPAIQVGGRGQWRVERVKLEEYIARMYEQADKQRGKLQPEDLPD